MKTQFSIERQECYWNKWQTTTSDSDWHRTRSGRVLQLISELGLSEDIVALDNGCGTGWFTLELAKFSEQAIGIDLTNLAGAQNSDKPQNVEFIHDDFQTFEFKKKFDLIVSQQVISHVDDQELYIRKNAELLNPKGYFVVTGNQKFIMNNLGTVSLPSHLDEGHYENWLSIKELEKLLSPYFNVVKRTTVVPLGNGGPLRLVNSYKLGSILGRLISKERLTELKEKLGFGLFYILVMQKR